MNILANKHVVIAMLMAPVLALISYFAVDKLMADPPQAAVSGESYRLIEQSNCRYNSGQCALINGNFELRLKANWLGEGRMLLELQSEHPLDGVKIAKVSTPDDFPEPQDMRRLDTVGARWQMELVPGAPDRERLRLVASVDGAFYFADASMNFSLYESSIEPELEN